MKKISDNDWDITEFSIGTVFKDFVITDNKTYDTKSFLPKDADKRFVRVIVMRGPASLCAYVGVLPGHPFYEKPYEEMDESVGVHCGFTFSSGSLYGVENSHKMWWFGWDYAHAFDYTFYPSGFMKATSLSQKGEKHTIGEVYNSCADIANQILNLHKIKRQFRMIRPLNEKGENL